MRVSFFVSKPNWKKQNKSCTYYTLEYPFSVFARQTIRGPFVHYYDLGLFRDEGGRKLAIVHHSSYIPAWYDA